MVNIRENKFLKGILYILLYLGIYIIVRSLVFGVFQILSMNIFSGKHPGKINYSELSDYINAAVKKNINIIVIITNIITLIIYLITDKIRKRRIFSQICINKRNISYAVSGIIIAVCLNIIFACIINYFKLTSTFTNFGQETNMLYSGNNIFIVILVLGIAAPAFEEILFRGIILRELKGNCSLVIAVLIQALLFGIWHGEVLAGINAFIMAIIFAVFYIRTDSLIVPMLLHSSFNLSSLVIRYYLDKNTLINLSFLMISICAVLIILAAGFLRIEKKAAQAVNS